jgi:predicted unusual protein kinase regulating ubiquinone biosynthesis (AarF/ABC1/UbiB family)
LARDKWENGGANWERNQPMRAKQILKICTRLGTTAIKIGQALSIRGDLLPGPYVKELSELQDKARARRRAASRSVVSSGCA